MELEADPPVDRSIHAGEQPPPAVPFPAKRRRQVRLTHADFSTSWKSELAAMHSTSRRLVALVAIIFAVILPFHVGSDIIQIMVLSCVAAVGAIGLNIVSGTAGQLSLGQAAFLGLGAYTAGWVTTEQGWSFWLALPLGAVMGGLLGLIIAPVALRLRGLYLAVVTLGLVYLMQHLFRTMTQFTNGTNGQRVVAPQIGDTDLVRGGTIAGIDFPRGSAYYLLCLALAIGAAVIARNVLKSRTGRTFAAIREQDIAAGIVGVNNFRARTQAFVISSAMAGVAGAMLAGYIRFINYDQWSLLLSVEYLAMIVIGGLATVSGAILGAIFVTALPTVIDRLSGFVPFISSSEAGRGLTPERLSAVLYGALLALVMVVEPRGLRGLWLRIRDFCVAWPFKR